MSDTFTCLSLEQILNWIKREEPSGKIFGIPSSLFFTPREDDVFRISRYGRWLETPVGVAAGPHTQLSQNIICAWLTGARYIELKTVQVLDELDVTKPCINMADEGYNCEWSQELRLENSFDEYLNALVAIYILKQRLGLKQSLTSTAKEPGFIFNMSVGYNLDGILSLKVQKFLDAMADAKDKIHEKLKIAQTIFPEAADLIIPSTVSDNITISTMHGCPPDEIEKIGLYFIEQRKLNTTIKLNPTLLGPVELRDILNNRLGFDITVPDLAFDHDLKYDAGVKLIRNLLEKAKAAGVEFNIKLTNTLETQNNKNLLPEKESMLYMSGRALHAISINLASKLQKEFNGSLDISFSAGADCFNLPDILSCGLKPVTVCSDILKPGGYARIAQYLSATKDAFAKKNADSVSAYIQKTAQITGDEKQAALANLMAYAKSVKVLKQYQKKSFPWSTIKTDRELEPFDCIHAPCRGTCPAGQDVPSYMYYTAKGMFKEAFDAILQTNPFPNVQGMVCDHPCMQKCTRINYDEPLKIREIKRFVARQNTGVHELNPLPDNYLTAAVIGGGPSGFSAAYFLKMNGFSVDVFEAKPFGGGMAADAIPRFRLDDESIQKDIDRIISLGVNVHYANPVDENAFAAIKEKYDYVYIGVGATKAYPLEISGADVKGVYDQLEFLSSIRQGRFLETGKNIVVIGGGNSAMDACRSAKRLAGKDGNVTILYRRSIKQMPADLEEIEAVQKEGIEIQEMVAPQSVISENGRVSGITCLKMKPGDLDASGRPRPVAIKGSDVVIPCDTIISAIGQQVVIPFLKDQELKVNPKTFQTGLEKVYAGGDAIRGASTLIKAIADGQKAVQSILIDAAISGKTLFANKVHEKDIDLLERKMATRCFGTDLIETEPSNRDGFDLVIGTMTKEMAVKEASRCLSCDTLCNICTIVCPNRANISYTVAPFKAQTFKAVCENGNIQIETVGTFTVSQSHQVINMGDFCNECGNCTTFCPTSGSPYLEKPKFYLSMAEFEKEPFGYCIQGKSIFKIKEGIKVCLTENIKTYTYDSPSITAKMEKDSFKVIEADFKTRQDQEMDLAIAAELGFLYIGLKDFFKDFSVIDKNL
ncbi:MAG: putative selenate reductase subunit YgfK [Proteobacteria bacterium]|nr:putative selenate reductase subunit YgfK [Pseudomonadota bacterium]MBU1582451.1 putative selenate reductase subunit YgfK [Pseudomonadota bacterium]MBU2630573.1 putative selenate reductase subunit YgfK [Pseudomonadota bacterium]